MKYLTTMEIIRGVEARRSWSGTHKTDGGRYTVHEYSPDHPDCPSDYGKGDGVSRGTVYVIHHVPAHDEMMVWSRAYAEAELWSDDLVDLEWLEFARSG